MGSVRSVTRLKVRRLPRINDTGSMDRPSRHGFIASVAHPARETLVDNSQKDQADIDTIDSQIGDRRRMLVQQCLRITRQVNAGRAPGVLRDAYASVRQ
jgi:hypothetical protein